jgi:hypothetical protein
MNLNTALAIVIGVLGAVATWLYVGRWPAWSADLGDLHRLGLLLSHRGGEPG